MGKVGSGGERGRSETPCSLDKSPVDSGFVRKVHDEAFNVTLNEEVDLVKILP